MERRVLDRIEIDLSVGCRIPATPRRARVCDASHSGCQVKFDEGPIIDTGSTVHIDLGGSRPVTGEVVWVNRRQAGIRFARRLSNAHAVRLGLEEPEPVVVVEEAPIPLGEVIRHWFRTMMGKVS